MDGRARWGNVIVGARRWWVPGLVVVVLAALVLVPMGLSSRGDATERLADGTTIAFGGSRITVGSGWEMSRTSTNLDQRVVLRRGEVEMTANAVRFPQKTSIEEAWSGFERLLLARGGDIGVASPFATHDGHKGWMAPVVVDGRTGTAFLVPSVDGMVAVEGTALGPVGDEVDHVAALDAIASITIPGDNE